ncbi:MAG: hypothetical protein MI723_05745 [Caulobacterales bacterium]|nr:hypothetical protein [Caulobacterales bacterium]
MNAPLLDRLRAALGAFDGAAVTILGEVGARHSGEPGYAAALVALTTDADPLMQRAGSWLLLDHVRSAGALGAEDLARLGSGLERIADWQTALHVLQALDHIPPVAPPAEPFIAFAEHYLDHARPFLRAWSMNALRRLALAHPALTPRADAARTRALNDPAASVRARARARIADAADI